MTLLNKFTRITSTGTYIGEIDGLRFLAILWVFVFHLNDYLVKNYHGTGTKIFQDFLGNGHLGVELFFVISGFVLSLPFAGYYFKQKKKVNIGQYFLRRLTRLEPPYFLVMIFLFFFLSATQYYSAKQLLPHLLASLLYIHNFVYPGSLPVINSVAWSLEIEIQFYVMVPLLACIFILKKNLRRLLLVSMMIVLPVMQYFYKSDVLFFYQFLQYFVAGFLLADLYVNDDGHYFYSPVSRIKKNAIILSGFVVLGGILLVPSTRTDLAYTILVPLAIVLFYNIVLFNPFWKRIFNIKLLSTLGGMSYTIYLIHLPVISTFGRFFVKIGNSENYLVYFIIQFCIMSLLTMIPCCLFFYYIERPCMQKDWYIKLSKKGYPKKK